MKHLLFLFLTLMMTSICFSQTQKSYNSSEAAKKYIMTHPDEKLSSWDKYFFNHPDEAPEKWKSTHLDSTTFIINSTNIIRGNYSNNPLEVIPGKTLKEFGICLSSIGFISMSSGIVIHLSNLNKTAESEDEAKKLLNSYKMSQYLMGIGAISTTLGIFCTISGNRKIMEYKINKSIKLESYVSPKSTGLTLTYKF